MVFTQLLSETPLKNLFINNYLIFNSIGLLIPKNTWFRLSSSNSQYTNALTHIH